jgi:hypothetical protein
MSERTPGQQRPWATRVHAKTAQRRRLRLARGCNIPSGPAEPRALAERVPYEQANPESGSGAPFAVRIVVVI